MSRFRWISVLCLTPMLLALSACGGSSTPAAGTSTVSGKSVGYISFGPVAASAWEKANWAAMQAAAEEYDLQLSNREGVGFDQAVAVMTKMAAENDVIIANSSIFETAMLEVAAKFPAKKFVLADNLSPDVELPNVSGFGAEWNDLGYLGGAAACISAQAAGKNAVGHVTAVPIPALTHFAGGAKDGAEAQGCEFLITWTNSFTDTSAGKQAALAMISEGAGAITAVADSGESGAEAAAQQEGLPYIANYLPHSGAMTSLLIDFDATYDEIGQAIADDALKGGSYPKQSVRNGLVLYSTPFVGVSPEVEESVLAVQAEIESGAITVDPTSEVKP